MAQVTLKGNPIHTIGELPEIGSKAPDFTLAKTDLSDVSLSDFKGKNVVLNIFPSLETSVCSTSIREFNKRAAGLKDTVVLCISMDLPFAHNRFCISEGIEHVVNLSCFRDEGKFATDYGVKLLDGSFKGLNMRSVVVIDRNGMVKYTQLVPEVSTEPDYEKAIAALN